MIRAAEPSNGAVYTFRSARVIALRYVQKPRPAGSPPRGIQVFVPEVEADRVLAGSIAPERRGGESHRVEMLRARPVAARIAVGKAEDAANGVDDAGFAPRIARQAGMACGVDVAGDHAVAGREAGDDALVWHAGRGAGLDGGPNLLGGEGLVQALRLTRIEHAPLAQQGAVRH